MKWPRGRYNGQRITGVEVKVRLDLRWWRFGLPTRNGVCLSIGPLHIWTTPAYEWD